MFDLPFHMLCVIFHELYEEGLDHACLVTLYLRHGLSEITWWLLNSGNTQSKSHEQWCKGSKRFFPPWETACCWVWGYIPQRTSSEVDIIKLKSCVPKWQCCVLKSWWKFYVYSNHILLHQSSRRKAALEEFCHIREEQDREFQHSLQADRQKLPTSTEYIEVYHVMTSSEASIHLFPLLFVHVGCSCCESDKM